MQQQVEVTDATPGTRFLLMRIPGMRQDGSLRPTAQGTPLAKDA